MSLLNCSLICILGLIYRLVNFYVCFFLCLIWVIIIGIQFNQCYSCIHNKPTINIQSLSNSMPMSSNNALSMPYIQSRKTRHHSQFREKRENTENSCSQNVLQKLPIVKMKRLMTKIGASQDLQRFIQVPSQEKREQLSRVKWDQLKKEYFPQKEGKEPFDGDLDELVIDCWKPGFNSKKAVWKEYRQQHRDLTYKTIKIIMKK